MLIYTNYISYVHFLCVNVVPLHVHVHVVGYKSVVHVLICCLQAKVQHYVHSYIPFDCIYDFDVCFVTLIAHTIDMMTLCVMTSNCTATYP